MPKTKPENRSPISVSRTKTYWRHLYISACGNRADNPRGELIRYTEREQLLLDQLEHGTLLSLNRYCRQTGISRRAAEHLLAKFVRYGIAEPVFENHKFYFRMKGE